MDSALTETQQMYGLCRRKLPDPWQHGARLEIHGVVPLAACLELRETVVGSDWEGTEYI